MTRSALSAVFIGSDTLLMQCAQSWQEQGQTIKAIVTDSERLAAFARERDIDCLSPEDLGTQLAELRFDYLFAVTWLHLLSDEVLRLPRRQAINFHDGPLPRYAGLNAPCWSIWNGETEHGVTWHAIEPGVDTGPILRQSLFEIDAEETALTLNARCFAKGLESFADLIQDLLAGTANLQAQDLSQRSYYGSQARPPRLGVLDWNQPAQTAERLVRAFDHGNYRNPLGVAKVWLGQVMLVPGTIRIEPGSGQSPGTVTDVGEDFVQVATADAEVRLSALRHLSGATIKPETLLDEGIIRGSVLPDLDEAATTELEELAATTTRAEPVWIKSLGSTRHLPVPGGEPANRSANPMFLEVSMPASITEMGGNEVRGLATAAMCTAFLARKTGQFEFDLGFAIGRHASAAAQQLLVDLPPARIQIDSDESIHTVARETVATLVAAQSRGPLLTEVGLRYPGLPQPQSIEPPVRILIGEAIHAAPGTLTLAIDVEGCVTFCYDTNSLSVENAERLAHQLRCFIDASISAPMTALNSLPLLTADQIEGLLALGRGSTGPLPTEPRIDRQFVAQVERSPDRIALRAGHEALTYAQLAQRVDTLAAVIRDRGVQTGDRVGICTQRGVPLVAATLACLRAGAAYVPLDPNYPAERLRHMAKDARLSLLITDRVGAERACLTDTPRLLLDDAQTANDLALPADNGLTGEHPAYVIYTSGSTGLPKGVVVLHRNVANFFAGMDEALEVDATGTASEESPGTWLAVTSLSFDISVLELLWTLCRGFEVVVQPGQDLATMRHEAKREANQTSPAPVGKTAFSLFFFASEESQEQTNKYELLLESARFADQNGFEAVWTPERHFHAFGGLYPNPAITSAALAAVTENVQIRAGSCVSPLHSPIRIAEDWSVIDNLSNGRVGLSFASGWQPEDFVLAPAQFADRNQRMFEDIATVRALWRGETLQFPGHDGENVAVRTLPRPIHTELPVWMTIAGNPDNFRRAGQAGLSVLTHLLGQSIEELTEKLEVYQAAWNQAGHPGRGHVTLMLHSFVGNDEQTVRETVRKPLTEYLRSSVDLIRKAAWSFPTFHNRTDGSQSAVDQLLADGIGEQEMDALLEFAFERYYRDSGLFGTPESCTDRIAELRECGVDEVACLIDFGIPTQTVLAGLPELKTLMDRVNRPAPAKHSANGTTRPIDQTTVAEQIASNRVTHLQCTPSMAAMLLLDPQTRGAFQLLTRLLVGGEALPADLARQLVYPGCATYNMYGPTETTVWSSYWQVQAEQPVSIGRPLQNQTVYLLDAHQQLVARGETGELWIGGASVVEGYFQQAERTEERFQPDPFADPSGANGARMYRTGDLARWDHNGMLEFQGRVDQQVKIRGYRVELGEIETALSQHEAVREVVVTANDDGDGQQLVAFLVADGKEVTDQDLRDRIRTTLPEFMVPQQFFWIEAMPRTPNQKIDRKALKPQAKQTTQQDNRPRCNAANAIEQTILSIWQEALGNQDIDAEDNFFDSGGHSILAVQVHRTMERQLQAGLQLTDLFRFPTVRSLAEHVSNSQTGTTSTSAASRAAARGLARRNYRRSKS
ncbi:MAG: MupA/Atu3671 family FMN-dependent luciferase-like monooxygenase [Planctomycetota bacterium]|nr:MupA/Atu3671 family FMN-dependent luciferase-like monooxygenase [Planctomycetota bacterium]